MVDVATGEWRCEEGIPCLGEFMLRCPDDPVPHGLNASVCHCEAELWMTPDCQEAFYCDEREPDGGVSKTCEDGTIIDINYQEYKFRCTDEVEKCPDQMGGFNLGCRPGNPPPKPPVLPCEANATNLIGECMCDGQIHINEDCSESFYCRSDIGSGMEGCHLVCGQGEIVKYNPTDKMWLCETKTEYDICPGKFYTGCPNSESDIHCGCKDEIWVDEDCSSVIHCTGPEMDGDNPGFTWDCPEDDTIFNMDIYSPFNFKCSDQVLKS